MAMSLIDRLDGASSKRRVKRFWLILVILIFLILIILPSIYVLFEAVSQWGSINEVVSDSGKMAVIWGAVGNSFSIAFIVTIIDIIVGIPMAWLMVRKNFPGKRFVDTLIDMPLAFPTAALGFSVAIFWGIPQGLDVPGLGIVVSPYVLVILLHLIFTYPYMVRTLSGILEQLDPNFETAGMTLGASRFTAVRTITLPLFRAGLVTGFILCFARSLSETGGTYIALNLIGKQSAFFTGPTFISDLKNQAGSEAAMPELILISVLLIVFALLMLFVAKLMMDKVKIPWSKVWPKFERRISRGLAVKMRNGLSSFFLALFIIIPSFFIFSFLLIEGPLPDMAGLFKAMGISFLVAGAATMFDIIFGIPMALYIARNKDKGLGKALDMLVNVPLIIPTTALGLSLYLFWSSASLPGLVLVILGHISFTYPLVVRNVIGAVEEVDPSYEEIAKTLGAKPFQAFRKVLLPVIQSSVLAGAILAFTRSLGETGATIAIDPTINTVPIYIVNLINKFRDLNNPDYVYQAAVASITLTAVCFVMMVAVKYVTRRKLGGRGHD